MTVSPAVLQVWLGKFWELMCNENKGKEAVDYALYMQVRVLRHQRATRATCHTMLLRTAGLLCPCSFSLVIS